MSMIFYTLSYKLDTTQREWGLLKASVTKNVQIVCGRETPEKHIRDQNRGTKILKAIQRKKQLKLKNQNDYV